MEVKTIEEALNFIISKANELTEDYEFKSKELEQESSILKANAIIGPVLDFVSGVMNSVHDEERLAELKDYIRIHYLNLRSALSALNVDLIDFEGETTPPTDARFNAGYKETDSKNLDGHIACVPKVGAHLPDEGEILPTVTLYRYVEPVAPPEVAIRAPFDLIAVKEGAEQTLLYSNNAYIVGRKYRLRDFSEKYNIYYGDNLLREGVNLSLAMSFTVTDDGKFYIQYAHIGSENEAKSNVLIGRLENIQKTNRADG